MYQLIFCLIKMGMSHSIGSISPYILHSTLHPYHQRRGTQAPIPATKKTPYPKYGGGETLQTHIRPDPREHIYKTGETFWGARNPQYKTKKQLNPKKKKEKKNPLKRKTRDPPEFSPKKPPGKKPPGKPRGTPRKNP